jgi:hypothetical protein
MRFTTITLLISASLLAGLALLSGAQTQAPASKKEMTMHATGPFDVKMAPQDDKSTEGLSRFLLDKQYHGDLDGTAKGQMLTNGVSADGSGVYVAMEKFTGILKGRSGSFVLHHTGVMTRGTPQLTIAVVPDSGTGELAGIAGTMTINIVDKKHSYDFEYTLPATQ